MKNELPRGKPRGISPFPTLKNIFWKQEMGCRWIGNFITAFALIPLIESLKQYCTAASRGVLNQMLTNKFVRELNAADLLLVSGSPLSNIAGIISNSPFTR